MSLTHPQKDDFNDWLIEILEDPDNAAAIVAKGVEKGITFDVAGTVTLLKAKRTLHDGKVGAVTAADAIKQNAVKAQNDAMNDWYKESSSQADAVAGFMGKDNNLSKLIHQKRDSYTHASPVPTP